MVFLWHHLWIMKPAFEKQTQPHWLHRFFLSLLMLTSFTSFQFSICILIVFKFFSTSCNLFPSLHLIWCKIFSSISVGVKLFKYIFHTTFLSFHEVLGGEVLVLHQIVLWDSFWHGGVCYTPSTTGQKSLCCSKRLFIVDKDLHKAKHTFQNNQLTLMTQQRLGRPEIKCTSGFIYEFTFS